MNTVPNRGVIVYRAQELNSNRAHARDNHKTTSARTQGDSCGYREDQRAERSQVGRELGTTPARQLRTRELRNFELCSVYAVEEGANEMSP